MVFAKLLCPGVMAALARIYSANACTVQAAGGGVRGRGAQRLHGLHGFVENGDKALDELLQRCLGEATSKESSIDCGRLCRMWWRSSSSSSSMVLPGQHRCARAFGAGLAAATHPHTTASAGVRRRLKTEQHLAWHRGVHMQRTRPGKAPHPDQSLVKGSTCWKMAALRQMSAGMRLLRATSTARLSQEMPGTMRRVGCRAAGTPRLSRLLSEAGPRSCLPHVGRSWSEQAVQVCVHRLACCGACAWLVLQILARAADPARQP